MIKRYSKGQYLFTAMYNHCNRNQDGTRESRFIYNKYNSRILNTYPIFRYVKTEAELIVIFLCHQVFFSYSSLRFIPRGLSSILCTALDLSRDKGEHTLP